MKLPSRYKSWNHLISELDANSNTRKWDSEQFITIIENFSKESGEYDPQKYVFATKDIKLAAYEELRGIVLGRENIREQIYHQRRIENMAAPVLQAFDEVGNLKNSPIVQMLVDLADLYY